MSNSVKTTKEKYIERFWSKVEKTHSCWFWTGSITSWGYGQVWFMAKHGIAHKISYELAYGPVDTGKHVDHLCRNRACVRPDHLEMVSKKENILRGESPPAINGSRKVCKRGHLFTKRKDQRVCNECVRIKYKERVDDINLKRRARKLLRVKMGTWRENVSKKWLESECAKEIECS